MKKRNIYIVSLIIFILDLIIKQIIINNLKTSISVIDNFFTLYLVKNTGGAFSVLSNNVGLLSIIGIIFLIGIIKYINNNKNMSKIESISISFLLGGLLGNLFDRIVRSGVIDYLSFNFLGYYFPVFNLADIFITLGVMLILVNEVRGDLLENRNRKCKN